MARFVPSLEEFPSHRWKQISQVGNPVSHRVSFLVSHQVVTMVNKQIMNRVWNQVVVEIGNQVWNQVRSGT